MITEHDLQEAIAECVGERNPTASTCIKLAAFYVIKNNMFPESKTMPSDGVGNLSNLSNSSNYSYSGSELDLNQAKSDYNVVTYDSGSEFSGIINGGDINQILEVIDDAMNTLSIVNPRFYNSIMNKLSEI